MKPEFTKKPEFMRLAAEQKQKELMLLSELLRFFLVVLISTAAAGLLCTVPTMLWLYSGERGQALTQSMLAGDADELLNRLFGLFVEQPDWMSAMLIAANGLLGVGAIVYCTRIERRSLRSMGLCGKNALGSYLLGALLGAVLFGATVGLALAFGGVEFSGIGALQELWPTLLMMFGAFVLQGAGEELLARGYLMVSLSKRSRLSFCVVCSSVVFGLLHIGNIGAHPTAFLNLVLLGAVLGLLVLAQGNLWGACAFHTFWNFLQSSVFGLTADGQEASGSLLTLRVSGHSSLLTGGMFGLEGSLCATLVLLAGLGALIFLLSRRAPEPLPEEDVPV